MTALEIIQHLDLKPHPEGGWYRETFRDMAGAVARARSTAIYYLLEAGQRSHWHRVDAAEVWHFYAGAPLKLSLAPPAGPQQPLLLGPNLGEGQRPQIVAPEGWWQSAESLGDFTLVGCTVAPGFEFGGFEMAPTGWTPT